MRSNRGVIIGVLVAVTMVGLFTWAIISHNKWTKACHNAGGQVAQQYEYTQINTHYIHDSKGNITGSYTTSDPVYSDHCIVGGQEIKP